MGEVDEHQGLAVITLQGLLVGANGLVVFLLGVQSDAEIDVGVDPVWIDFDSFLKTLRRLGVVAGLLIARAEVELDVKVVGPKLHGMQIIVGSSL